MNKRDKLIKRYSKEIRKVYNYFSKKGLLNKLDNCIIYQQNGKYYLVDRTGV